MATIASLIVSIGADIADLKTDVTKASGAVESGVSKINSAVDAMKATAAFGAVVAMLGSVADAADELDTLSARIDDTAGNVQRLQAISESYDVSLESMIGAIQVMQQKLGDGKLDSALEKLNVNVEDFKSAAPAEQYVMAAEALAKIKDPAERAAAAQELMGKAAKANAGAFRDGVGDVDRWIKMSDGAVSASDRISTFLGKAKSSLVNFSAEVLYSVTLLREWDRLMEYFGEAKLPDVKPPNIGPKAAAVPGMPSAKELDDVEKSLDASRKHAEKLAEASDKTAEKAREAAKAFADSATFIEIAYKGWITMPPVVEDTSKEIKEIRDSMEAMDDITFNDTWLEFQKGVEDSGAELDKVHARMRTMLTWRDVGKNLAGAVMGAIQGGGDVGRALGGEAGQMLGTKLGTSIGDWAGKAIGGSMGAAIGGAAGSVLPVVGTILGSLAGSFVGKLFGGGNKEAKEIASLKLSDEFGGIKTAADALGISMDKVFSAKKVDDFKAALANVAAQIDEQNALHDRGIAAMEKYGITIEQAGQKFKQTQMNDTAEDLIEDFQGLVAIGVDYDTIIEKMGGSVGEYIQKCIEMGVTVPRELQGIAAKMIENGTLIDKNGDKFTDLSQIPFADSINQGLSTLIAKLDILLDKIGVQLPRVINSVPDVDFDINGHVNAPGVPDIPAMAKGGIVTRPTVALIGEAGPEAIVPLRGGRGVGNTWNVSLTLNNGRFGGYADSSAFAREILDALSLEADRRGMKSAFAGA